MAKVYVMTAGEYSDYRIYCVVSTEERAKAMEAYGLETEEYEVDAYPLPPKGHSLWCVEMAQDGQVINSNPYVGSCFEDRIKLTSCGAKELILNSSPFRDGPVIIVDCWAKSLEHAIKITNEKRIQALAENRLLTS